MSQRHQSVPAQANDNTFPQPQVQPGVAGARGEESREQGTLRAGCPWQFALSTGSVGPALSPGRSHFLTVVPLRPWSQQGQRPALILPCCWHDTHSLPGAWQCSKVLPKGRVVNSEWPLLEQVSEPGPSGLGWLSQSPSKKGVLGESVRN